MANWTNDMASALPSTIEGADTLAPADLPVQAGQSTTSKNPQAHGWAATTAYDYASYNKSNKDLSESQPGTTGDGEDFGVGGVAPGEWASNAAIYQWDDEYGDVGPKFPELEDQLFGAANHVRTGVNFSVIQSIEVIQEGSVRLQPIRKFEDAGLHPVMLENVKLAGYNTPTPIQQYTLPAISKGHDIVACAQTGSGKTAAFLIPILSKLMGKAKKLTAPRPNPVTFQAGITPPVRAEPLVLIVCPSRELATQIFDEARRFCYRTMLRPAVVYGGGPVGEQINSLAKGCDLLIGTPGRLIDFIGRPHVLTLKRLKYMILDEADEMLHADWETDLKQIMSGGDQEEGNIVYMMFSATFPKVCRDLAKDHLAHDHVRIRVGRAGSTHSNIQQDIVWVEASKKRKAVQDLLLSTPPCRAIIFVNSKRAADEVDDFLFNSGFPCTSIHGDRTQREREDSIRAFRSGKAPILIATGVSARGLDIHNVMHVINFDLPSPQYGGIEEYTHRIGRTGRIGNMGLATSFYNERDADFGPALVKTLIETHQIIPDFLQEYVPEGFTPTGDGDLSQLKFEADSDFGDGNGEESADAGGGWGSTDAPATGGWGAEHTEAAVAPVAGGWGAEHTEIPAQDVQVAPTGSTLGAPAPDLVGASQPIGQPMVISSQTPVGGSWGMPTVPAPTGQPAQPVWIAPAPVAPTFQPSQPGWGPSAPVSHIAQAAQPIQQAWAPASVAPNVQPAQPGWGPSAPVSHIAQAAQPIQQAWALAPVAPNVQPAQPGWGPSAPVSHIAQAAQPIQQAWAPAPVAPNVQPAQPSWGHPAPVAHVARVAHVAQSTQAGWGAPAAVAQPSAPSAPSAPSNGPWGVPAAANLASPQPSNTGFVDQGWDVNTGGGGGW